MKKDRLYLLQKENQQQVARKLLAGIEGYLQAGNQTPLPVKKNDVDAGSTSAVIADTLPSIALQSGATLTVAQLQAIPFAKLIQPDTDHTIESASLRIQLKNRISYMKLNDSQKPASVKALVDGAESGDVIAFVDRVAITKDQQRVNLPNLFYKVK